MTALRIRRAASPMLRIVRRALPLLAIAYLADAAFIFVFLIALQSYLPESLGASTALAGWALAAFGAAKLCSQVASGVVADRIGTRRAMAGGAAMLLAADAAMLPLAHVAPNALIAAAALEGLGSSLLWPALYASGSARFEVNEKSRFTSLLTLATVAALATALGGGTLLDLYAGFNTAMIAPIAFTAAALAIALALHLEHERAPQPAGEPAPALRDLAPLLRSRRRAGFAAIVLAESIALGALTAVFRAYGRDVAGVSLLHQGLLLAPAAVLGALAVVMGGALADRVGARRVLVPGFALSGVAILLLSQVTQPALIVVVAAAGGAGFGIAVPSIASTMLQLAGDRGTHAGIIGWFMTMDGMGHAIGPAAAALIVATTGAAGVLALSGAGFIAVAAIAAVALGEPAPEAPTQEAHIATGAIAAPTIMRPEGQS